MSKKQVLVAPRNRTKQHFFKTKSSLNVYLLNSTDVTNSIAYCINSTKHYRNDKIRNDYIVQLTWDQISLSLSLVLLKALFIFIFNTLQKKEQSTRYKLYAFERFFLFRYINLFFLSFCLFVIPWKVQYFSLTDNRICISIQTWGTEQIFDFDQMHPICSSEQSPLYTCKAHIFQVDPDTRKSWLPLSNGAGMKSIKIFKQFLIFYFV
jgi:hypothetical protein